MEWIRTVLGERVGDCMGAIAAGMTFVLLSQGNEGPEGSVFTTAGWLMVSAGLVAVICGRRKR